MLDRSEYKQKLLARLKTVEGHVRGVQRMVEDDTYCIDLLTQTRAIRQALLKIDTMILENHLNTCVTTALRSEQPDERERVLRELLHVFDATRGTNDGRDRTS
jgi:DNA-binding FrmR family transcriptional regulator